MVDLVNLLSRTDISKKDTILLILYSNNQPTKVSEIKSIASENGKHVVAKWNVSDLLTKSKSFAVRLKDGWCLTDSGKQRIIDGGFIAESTLKNHENVLRSYLDNINNPEVKAFLSEAISCLEHHLFRSAVVLSWIGAISILYDEVLRNHLSAFNQEYLKRFPKKKKIKTKDDFSLLKEYDFLQIIASISMIGKNVKQQLEQNLQLRNSCGHPNSMKIKDYMVQAHLEFLIINIYEIFI